MAEPIVTEAPEAPEPVVVKTSRLKNFKVNHPRTAKVAGIAAVTAATFGVIAFKKSRKQDVDTTEDTTSDAPYDNSSETI